MTENLAGVIQILSNDLVIGDDSDDDDDDMDLNESTLLELAKEGFAMKRVEASPGPSMRKEMSSNDSLALQSQDISQIYTPNLIAKSKKKRKRQRSASSEVIQAETSEIDESLNDSNALQLGAVSSDETPVKEKKHKKKKRQSSANSDTVEGEETQISPEKHSSSEVEASGGDRKHKKKKKKDREISLDPDVEKAEEISKYVEHETAEENLSFTSPEAKTPKKKKRSSKELTPTTETETSKNKEKKKHKDADGRESDLSGILDRSIESNAETSDEFKTPKASKKKKRSLDDSPQSQSENISQEEVPKRKKRKLCNTPLSTLDDF